MQGAVTWLTLSKCFDMLTEKKHKPKLTHGNDDGIGEEMYLVKVLYWCCHTSPCIRPQAYMSLHPGATSLPIPSL